MYCDQPHSSGYVGARYLPLHPVNPLPKPQQAQLPVRFTPEQLLDPSGGSAQSLR